MPMQAVQGLPLPLSPGPEAGSGPDQADAAVFLSILAALAVPPQLNYQQECPEPSALMTGKPATLDGLEKPKLIPGYPAGILPEVGQEQEPGVLEAGEGLINRQPAEAGMSPGDNVTSPEPAAPEKTALISRSAENTGSNPSNEQGMFLGPPEPVKDQYGRKDGVRGVFEKLPGLMSLKKPQQWLQGHIHQVTDKAAPGKEQANTREILSGVTLIKELPAPEAKAAPEGEMAWEEGDAGRHENRTFAGFLGRDQVLTVNTKENPLPQFKVPLPQLAEEIPRIIQEQVGRGAQKTSSKELVIRLEPKDLGKLLVKISSEEGVITVKILAEQAGTKNLVENGLSNLRQSFLEQGIKYGRMDVELGGQYLQQQNQHQQNQQQYQTFQFQPESFIDSLSGDHSYSVEDRPARAALRPSSLGTVDYLV